MLEVLTSLLGPVLPTVLASRRLGRRLPQFAFRNMVGATGLFRASVWAVLASMGFACLVPTAHAQTATFNTASVLNVSSSPLSSPTNVAADGEGNIYIADAGNNRVVEVMANSTINVLNVGSPVGKALNFPIGVAVDASGDVYIADANNERVVEYTAGGTANVLNVGSPGGTPLNFPQGLALDSAGDLYIADSNNSRVVVVSAGGAVSVVNAGGLPLSFPCGVALDNAGDLYIADSNNNRIVEVMAGGTASVLNVGTPGGTALSQPSGVAVSKTGSIYIADSNNNRVLKMLPGGTPIVLNVGSPDGTSLNYPNGVAVDGAGDVYISDTNNNRVVEVAPSSQALGQAAVGASANPVTMSYTVSGYSGSSYTPKFTMNYGTDVQVGTATCTGGASPETCSVLVTLHPQVPGARSDALQVLDPVSGAVLTQTLVHGIGNGPQGVFEPGTQSLLNLGSPGSTPVSPFNLAVDGAGNIYLGDVNNDQVVKVTTEGVTSILPVGTPGGVGLNFPDGVAVDGAGNVYIADNNNSRVVEVTAAGAVSVVNTGTVDGVSLNYPIGVAVDSIGNLYVEDGSYSRVIKVTVDGTAGLLNVGTPDGVALFGPTGLVVDSSGNVYITDTFNNRVVKVTASGTVSVVNVGAPGGLSLSFPNDPAVDGAGNLYIPDNGNNRVLVVAVDGTVSLLPINSSLVSVIDGPNGVALDRFGNVNIVDGSSRVFQLNRTEPSLHFPNTYVGQSSSQRREMLVNIGNQPLVLTALSVTGNFNLDGAATTCTDTTTLNLGGDECGLGVEFAPLTSGPLTGTVNLTDNNLNIAPSTTQTISLQGMGVQIIISPATLSAGTAGVAYTATFSASGGRSPYTYAETGTLPPGMSLSSTGVLTGTPTAGGTFSFTVTATDGNSVTGSQAYTLVVNLETTTLSFTAIPPKIYGNAPFTATASSASMGAITYSVVSGPATINASTGLVTLTGAATIMLEASQAASGTYNSATAETTFNVAQQPSAMTVSASSTAIAANQAVTLTATVSATIAGTATAPTGTVTFLNNGTALRAAASLVNGVGTLTVPSLPSGTAAVITAVYRGNVNFLGSASSNSVSIAIAAAPGFTFTNTGVNTNTVMPGTTATYNFAAAPLNGSYPGAMSFTVAGLPAGATTSFTPSTVAANAGAEPIVMTVQTAAAFARNISSAGRSLALALLLLPFGIRRSIRRKLKGWMLPLFLLAAGTMAAISGCGSHNGFFAETPQSYTLTVTATSGTLAQSHTVTLTVQ